MLRKIFLLLLWIACFGIAIENTGCALGDRNVTLKYKPIGGYSISGNKSVTISKFKDTRTNHQIGHVVDAHNRITASVWANNQDACEWITNALAEELRQAGVNVSRSGTVVREDTDIIISGEVKHIYVTRLFDSDPTIKTNITVTKNNLQILNKEYTGKGSSFLLTITMSADEYANALQNALQDMMKKVVPDIVEAIQF